MRPNTPPVPFEAAERGVVAAVTSLGRVDGDAGTLHYCGYDIQDLAREASYEEVCYLLWNRRLPSSLELGGLMGEMGENRGLPKPVLDLLWSFPREVHPMVAVRTALSALGAFDPDAEGTTLDDDVLKARRLTALVATVVAAWDRIRADRDPVDPDRKLGHAANFLYMLTGTVPDPAVARLFDAILVLHAEHGLNPSTFVARAAASTLTDLHAAVTAAMAALQGTLHGGANQAVMESLLKIGSRASVRPAIEHMLQRKQRVMGFGHPIYRVLDPRVPLLADVSKRLAELTGEMLWYEMSLEMQQVMAELRPDLKANVDFFAASALYVLGVRPDLTGAVFAASRIAGWTAHIIEQRRDNKFLRPTGAYVGQEAQPWVPMKERSKPRARRTRKPASST